MIKRYTSACSEFEDEIRYDPDNFPVMKKLVICYLKMGNFRKGFELFYSLLKANPGIILNDEYDMQTCPCLEIITDLQASAPDYLSESEYQMTLGILWSYLDIKESLKYFKKVRAHGGKVGKVEEIIERLQAKLPL
ncbi:MAG: hypothetical protein P8184_13240 [Calditrichia bacterium]